MRIAWMFRFIRTIKRAFKHNPYVKPMNRRDFVRVVLFFIRDEILTKGLYLALLIAAIVGAVCALNFVFWGTVQICQSL